MLVVVVVVMVGVVVVGVVVVGVVVVVVWPFSWGWACPGTVTVAPSSPQPQVAHMLSSLPSRGSSGRGRRPLRHRHCRRGTTGSSRASRSADRRCGSAPRRVGRRGRDARRRRPCPAVASSKQNCIESGTTAHSAPTSSLTLCTRRPAACSHTASTTLCVIAISCTSVRRFGRDDPTIGPGRDAGERTRDPLGTDRRVGLNRTGVRLLWAVFDG